MGGPGIKFLYVPCRELGAMRDFYGEMVGLHEIHHSAAEGLLAYDCAGFQFTIFESADARSVPGPYATQPGWEGGAAATVSWSVELDESGFRRAVSRLLSRGTACAHDEPQWVGYWSFPVRDPMGNTVEICWPAGSAIPPPTW